MVASVQSRAEFDDALKHHGLVLVDFFATWCGPCKMIAPYLDQLSQEYTGVKFIKVDVDQFNDLADEYDVTGMPTFIFIKNGVIVHKVIDAQKEALKQGLIDFA